MPAEGGPSVRRKPSAAFPDRPKRDIPDHEAGRKAICLNLLEAACGLADSRRVHWGRLSAAEGLARDRINRARRSGNTGQ